MSSKTNVESGTNPDEVLSEKNDTIESVELINEEILPGFRNFDDFVNAGFETLKNGIKAANSLPSGEKYDYYNCFPNFSNIVNGEVKNVLGCMQYVMEAAGVRGNIRRRDAEEKFELLVEANDILLERAGICMDEASGILRNPDVEFVVSHSNNTTVSGSWNNLASRSNAQQHEGNDNAQPIRLLTAKNIQRPQLKFEDKIDNSSKPWQPRIKDKPNSLKPLALFVDDDEYGEFFSHPYEFELDRFVPQENQLDARDPVKYKSLNDTSLIVIEKSEDIKILLNDLRQYTEIAIDLEHHSYRSFQGITCLMQISTKDTDYLIDTLTLRSHLQELNEIFTKPSVLKVFHGAGSDIEWLQRDLSLYIVNMFDTHIAAKQLNLPYLSLAYLLKRYCGVDPNKHFQLADWRVRPLPEELMKYAREDTHYLLYIKDKLSNALLEQANGQSNILKAVYDRSTDICKKVYRKPIWTEESCMNIYRKSKKMFNNKQLYALRELHKWRDVTARQEDDSTSYVLPNHMLLNIAESLPREMQGILACCNPIPPLVRQNSLWLHKIILKAREQPMIKPVIEDDIRQRMTQRNQTTDIETNLLYSPHDMPQGMEVRADLPCLLDPNNSAETFPIENNVFHYVTIFDSPPQSEDEEVSDQGTRKIKRKTPFISPFERYKRVLPMVAAEEAKEREKREKEEAEKLKLIDKSHKETVESIGRVYEHFKNISAVVVNPVSTQQSAETIKHQPTDSNNSQNATKSEQKPLSQMLGRKRKRQSNYYDDNKPTTSQVDLSTTVPFLHKKITQHYKQDKQEFKPNTPNRKKVEKPTQDAGHTSYTENDGEPSLKTMRCSKKKDKQANMNTLKERGMLPEQSFDYRNVDFSSFQGGSRAHGQVPFQAQNKKKNTRGNRGKGNRGKKQKW